MKLVLCVLILAVSLSMAGHPVATGNYGGTSNWQGTDDIVVWSQLPSTGLMASQKFTDYDSTAVDCGVADDFEFTTETTINKIRWWGGYWNGAGPFPVVCYSQIYLYNDDGTGNAPTLPEHSSAINYWAIAPADYTETVDGDYFVYEYIFPADVVFDANTKYWIEIRKAFDFAGIGQWGRVQSTPIFLSACVQGTIGFSGGPVYWTALANDAAFELISEAALEASTWAEIKTIF
ncbi:MAG: hypothetical protein GQ565_05155 [Candidatus Aegiribacteria sp.]|nr:hypothetical protein [Candidatus Aegiribacteria sp.]